MIQVSLQQTKQKEFSKAVRTLKTYISEKVPDKTDKKLPELLDAVLKPMFYEENKKVMEHHRQEWYRFLYWLLFVFNVPETFFLYYLKLIQKTIRDTYRSAKKKGKDEVISHVDFYFSPFIFKKSFTHKGLFEKRIRHTFLKQLVESFNKDKQVRLIFQEQSSKTKPPTEVKAIVQTVLQQKPIPVATDAVVAKQQVKQQKITQHKPQEKTTKPVKPVRPSFLGDIQKGKKTTKQQLVSEAVVAKQQKIEQQIPEQIQQVKQQSKQQSKPAKPSFLGDIKSGIALKKVKKYAGTVVMGAKQQTPKPSMASLLADIRSSGTKLKKIGPQNKMIKLQQQPSTRKSLLGDIVAGAGKLKKTPETRKLQQKPRQQTQEQKIINKITGRRKFLQQQQKTKKDDEQSQYSLQDWM